MTEARKIYWRSWLKAALIRAIRTFAQTLAATLAMATTIYDAPWAIAFGTAGLAAFLSLLTSLTGLPEVPGDDPQLFEGEEVVDDGDR